MSSDIIVESQKSASSDTLADLGDDRDEFTCNAQVQLEMRTCDGGCRDVFQVDELTSFDDCRHAVCGLCLTELTIVETPSGNLLCPIGPCRHANLARNVHSKLEYIFLKQIQYEHAVAEIKETTSDSEDISDLPTVTLSSEVSGLTTVSSYSSSSNSDSSDFDDNEFEGDPIDPDQSVLMSETMTTKTSDTSLDIFSETMQSMTDSSSSIDNDLREKLEALSCATATGVAIITDDRTPLLTSESLMSTASQ